MFSQELPKPILFHPLKHHLGHIVAYIKANCATPIPCIRQDLLTLGTSQMDLYVGPLAPAQLAQEVIAHLQERALLTPERFRQYLLGTAPHYRCITLSDKADWVLQWGVLADRYVHLHPARYAAYTIRVKAAALKTAIAVVMASQRQNTATFDVQLVNQVRSEWVGLAPVKNFERTAGAGKILELLLQHV
ncbi:hypothetical protein ACXYMU_19870 [Pontibacter sp. CAU 1760]